MLSLYQHHESLIGYQPSKKSHGGLECGQSAKKITYQTLSNLLGAQILLNIKFCVLWIITSI
jgi:hypothetical protein